MLTLQELKNSTRNGPYTKTVKVKIIAVGPEKQYSKLGAKEPSTMFHLSVAAETTWMKCMLYDPTKLMTIVPDASVALINYVKRDGQLVINNVTKVRACPATPVDVTSTTHQLAYEAIFPVSTPATITKIQTTHTAGQLWTVKGIIRKVSDS